MAHSSDSDHHTKSWDQLAVILPVADLFRRELFILPHDKYRGPPPIAVFCKAFPNYTAAQKEYDKFLEEGKMEDEAFASMQHLLESTTEGAITEENKSFWIEKAKAHLKKLAGKKRRRENQSSMERKTKLKRTSTRAAVDGGTSSDPFFSRSSPPNIDDYVVAAETQSQNSKALASRLRLMEDNPTELARFLSTERTSSLSNVDSFLEALRSGRLRPLKDAEVEHWGIEVPERFEVKDVCPDLDLEAVWGTALMNAKQATIYEGHRRNEPLIFQPSLISTLSRGISVGQPKYAVNIPLEDTKLLLPQHIEKQYKLYQQEGRDSVFLAQANIGTFGSVVDLHEDRGYLSATAMDHQQIKLWLLYPYHPNKTAYEKTVLSSARYPACEKELVGGLYALTYPGQGLVFRCLHATWTIRGGSLFGVTVPIAEGAVMAAEILYSDVLAGMVTSTSDMEPFLKSLHAAAVADVEDLWQQALSKLCNLEWRSFSEKRLQKTMLDLVEQTRLQLLGKLTGVCRQCDKTWEMHLPFSLKNRGIENGNRSSKKSRR